MHINRISITDFRSFSDTAVDFVFPGKDFANMKFPKPGLPNINLILGNNGSGKTTLLKAIAIAALGPAITSASLPMYRLIRRTSDEQGPAAALIKASFLLHEQDVLEDDEDSMSSNARSSPGSNPLRTVEASTTLLRKGDIELPTWTADDEKPWDRIFSNTGDAFFFVGYGATRRVETKELIDPGSRQTSLLSRAQRVRSIFEEAYSLIPISAWMPQLEVSNPGRYTQVVHLIERLLSGTGYGFTGERDAGEYLFQHGKLSIPFPALSDGYRAYLGWIGDLLYHVCYACPSGKNLVENKGIVLVDEIDLHLHPKWQMNVLPTLARALPNIQFIVTSHSPLVVGSLEWMNILLMRPGSRQSTKIERINLPVHGLDADQVLLTKYFGLTSTRASGKSRQLKTLGLAASDGDVGAARELILAMSTGSETPQ